MKDITQDIASSYEARIAEVGRLKTEATEMLSSFQASHREMSTELRKGLAQGETERKQASAELKKDLIQSVSARKSKVRGMRNGFQASHKEMSSALKKDLAEHTQGVRDGVARLRQEIGASHQDRSAEVKAMRSGFQSSHKEMSTELRKSLAQGETERKQVSAKLKNEVADYYRGIKKIVAGMRQEIRRDLGEARTAWQGLASTMKSRRGGAEIPLKAETPVAEEEIPDLETKMLAAVNEHPEGMTLAGVADSLGVVPVVLGRVSRSLVDKAEIRKKEKLYFPVSAE